MTRHSSSARRLILSTLTGNRSYIAWVALDQAIQGSRYSGVQNNLTMDNMRFYLISRQLGLDYVIKPYQFNVVRVCRTLGVHIG